MSVFQFILASLACFRLTILVTRDIGPFGSMKSVRKLSPKLLGCPYCVSIYVAAVIEALFYFSGVRDCAVVIGCGVFAMSAFTIILHRTFTSDYQP